MATELGGSKNRRLSDPFAGSEASPGTGRGDAQIGHRYEVINALGYGGMGIVYRALDRLTGRVVTLKRLRDELGPPAEARTSVIEEWRRLTAEFELLTSLRHPNIISVLEFGFDSGGQPFFTMDLEENAQTIVDAGRAQPLTVQVDLLVQCLRALAYLHDYGVIHRDLKPENLLVVRGQVKVLDFGLSIRRASGLETDAPWAGTLAFTAPEIIDGHATTVASDLYSFGMISLELLTGAYPFPVGNTHELLSHIKRCRLPRPEDRVDSRLRPVLERLLDKNPDHRFPSAAEVIEAFASALGQPLAVETIATRESFLQAAPFVGRRTELSILEGAVEQAWAGRGSSWLLAGESGLGKSRLLEELRSRALVRGALVLRAQSVADGGSPFNVWRDVIRALILAAQPNDQVAAALRSIVPDVSALLRREIADAPKVDPEAAQTRLHMAVENLFRLLDAPALVILEDLHWVGSESRALASRLSRSAPGLPLVLIGSIREDEAPELAAEIPAAKRIALQRLDAEEIAELGEAMIGSAARVPGVVALLQRESEGIPFFLVEVVRELAERSGGRGRIADVRLPESVVSGGMERSIRRRLDRVSGDALELLTTAAVVGREIDPRIMRAIHQHIDFDAWARICARAALIELRHQTWRFAHDKVREQLLIDLAPRERTEQHRRVAEALELEYPERRDVLAALAHHWREAGVRQREARYAEQAGFLALESGGCRESIALLGRALDILAPDPGGEPGAADARYRAPRTTWRPRLDLNAGVDPTSPSFRLGLIESALSEAHYRLGNLTGCREHAERALGQFGQNVPDGDAGWRRAAAAQWGLRVAQSLLRFHSPKSERVQTVARAIARVQGKLTDAAFYSLDTTRVLWSSARLVNQCDPAGPSAELARGYVILGLLANLMSAPWLANRWCRRALDIAEEAGSEQDVAWVLSRTCVLHQGNCRWIAFGQLMPRATAIAERVGDLKLWEECRAQTGAVHLYRGEYERALAAFDDSLQLSRGSGNRQVDCWALFGRADTLVRLGEHERAIPIYDSVLRDLDEEGLKTEAIWGLGSLAVALLHAGDEEHAYRAALRALAHIAKSSPIAYWTQPGVAGTAEVLLRLHERDWQAPSDASGSLAEQAGRARASLLGFAKRFLLGQPFAALWDGSSAWIGGRRGRAIRSWHRAIKAAVRLGTPYELGLAHLELGRHLSRDASQPHLAKAAEVFERLGCARELARARTVDENS